MVSRYQYLVTGISSPVPRYWYLVTGTSSPVPRYRRLVTGTSLPAPCYRYLVTGASLPVPRYRCLVTGASLPVPRYRYLVTGTSLPVPRYRYLVTGTSLPVPHYRYLVTGTSLPVPHHRYLITGTSLPVPHHWYLVTGTSLFPQLTYTWYLVTASIDVGCVARMGLPSLPGPPHLPCPGLLCPGPPHLPCPGLLCPGPPHLPCPGLLCPGLQVRVQHAQQAVRCVCPVRHGERQGEAGSCAAGADGWGGRQLPCWLLLPGATACPALQVVGAACARGVCGVCGVCAWGGGGLPCFPVHGFLNWGAVHSYASPGAAGAVPPPQHTLNPPMCLPACPQKMEDWLYEEGEDTGKSVYVAKLEELQKLGGPVEMRAAEAASRGPAADQLKVTCAGYMVGAWVLGAGCRVHGGCLGAGCRVQGTWWVPGCWVQGAGYRVGVWVLGACWGGAGFPGLGGGSGAGLGE